MIVEVLAGLLGLLDEKLVRSTDIPDGPLDQEGQPRGSPTDGEAPGVEPS